MGHLPAGNAVQAMLRQEHSTAGREAYERPDRFVCVLQPGSEPMKNGGPNRAAAKNSEQKFSSKLLVEDVALFPVLGQVETTNLILLGDSQSHCRLQDDQQHNRRHD